MRVVQSSSFSLRLAVPKAQPKRLNSNYPHPATCHLPLATCRRLLPPAAWQLRLLKPTLEHRVANNVDAALHSKFFHRVGLVNFYGLNAKVQS